MALAGRLNYVELLYTKGCLSFPVHTSVDGSGGRTKLVNGSEGERWHGLVSGSRTHLRPIEISGQRPSESNGKLLNAPCKEIHDNYTEINTMVDGIKDRPNMTGVEAGYLARDRKSFRMAVIKAK